MQQENRATLQLKQKKIERTKNDQAMNELQLLAKQNEKCMRK